MFTRNDETDTTTNNLAIRAGVSEVPLSNQKVASLDEAFRPDAEYYAEFSTGSLMVEYITLQKSKTGGKTILIVNQIAIFKGGEIMF